MNSTLPENVTIGALRSRLVAKLTGLTIPTLRHWHSSDLQSATRIAGNRGVPRVYSWIDYQRLCVMAGRKDEGVPTTRIRAAVTFLDDLYPEWWNLSLARYDGHVRGSQSSIHVVLRASMDILADVHGGQMSFRSLMNGSAERTTTELATALSNMQERGPLFCMNEFDDAIWMRPELNAGLPTIRGTSLESEFVVAYAQRTSIAETATAFRIDEARIIRARAFEAAA